MTEKTFITYQGGAAGDMFAASANGLEIDLGSRYHLPPPSFSIKPYENAIVRGDIHLETIVQGIPEHFITTHLYSQLQGTKCHTVSVIFTDEAVIEKVIWRQMFLQKLFLEVQPQQNFYRLLRNLVSKADWSQAARLWLTMASDYWKKNLQYRLSHPLVGSLILNFDHLFCTSFVDSVRSQGFTTNLDLIQINHRAWLERNLDHSQGKTLQSLRQKIMDMDWSGREHVVT